MKDKIQESLTEKIAPLVLFVIPPCRERVSNHKQVFAENGLKLCFAEFGYADVKSSDELFSEIIKVWGNNLLCVIFPQLDIIDLWVIEAKFKPKPGNIIEFLNLFIAKGIPIRSVNMDWGGPFDNHLILYDDYIPELLRFAKKQMKID